MASITIAELHPVGSELFRDSENFLNELEEHTTMSIHGGHDYSNFSAISDFSNQSMDWLPLFVCASKNQESEGKHKKWHYEDWHDW